MTCEEGVKMACICEKQKECNEISTAFGIIKDPRSGFLELQPPSAEGGTDSEKFQDACFRHLRPTDNDEQGKRQGTSPLFIALHHFPPEIVLLCAETSGGSPPVLSTLGSLSAIPEPTRKDIEVSLGEEDLALIEEGKSVGTYHVFPNYGSNQAKKDARQALKNVVRKEKKRAKASEKEPMVSPKQADEKASVSPTNVIDVPQSPLKEGGLQHDSPENTTKDLDVSEAVDNSSLEQDDSVEHTTKDLDVSEARVNNSSLEQDDSVKHTTKDLDVSEATVDNSSLEQDDSVKHTMKDLDVSEATVDNAPLEQGESAKHTTKDPESSEATVDTSCNSLPEQHDSAKKITKDPDHSEATTEDIDFSEATVDTFYNSSLEQHDSAKKHTTRDLNHSYDTVDTCCSSSLEPTTPSPNKEEETFIEEASQDFQKLKENGISGISADTENDGELEQPKTLTFDLDEGDDLVKKSCRAIDFMPSDLSLQSSESNDVDSQLVSPKPHRPEKAFLQSRSESMPILSVIESKRRAAMASRLDAVALEWNCYRDLIKDIGQETNRVDVLIQSSFQSLEGYVDSMRAISSDTFLDDRGKVVERARSKEKIATQRTKVARGVDDKESSMMNLLYYSFDQLVLRLDENLPALEEGAQEMAALKVEVQRRAEALIESGEKVLVEIEQYEANGEDAWGKFWLCLFGVVALNLTFVSQSLKLLLFVQIHL
jgi:hypothetical protein